MSNALAMNIADSIVAEINGHVWANRPEAFTATRKYVAKYQDGDVATIQVAVIPLTQEDLVVTRAVLKQTEVGAWIDLQRRCADFTSVSEMDGYVNFLVEIKDFFADKHRLASPLDAWWYQSADLFGKELWSPQRLYVDHVFEGAVELIVKADH